MKHWRTNVVAEDKSIEISIKRGILQGEALSALNPLSNVLKGRQSGYQLPESQYPI